MAHQNEPRYMRHVHKQHVEIVELLLARGANVNSINRLGRTPLYYAKELPEPGNPLLEEILRAAGALFDPK